MKKDNDPRYRAGVRDVLALTQLAKELGAEVVWPAETVSTPTQPAVPQLPEVVPQAPNVISGGTRLGRPPKASRDRFGLPTDGDQQVLAWIDVNVKPGQQFSSHDLIRLLRISTPPVAGRIRRLTAWALWHPEVEIVRTANGSPKTHLGGTMYRRNARQIAGG